MRSRMRVLAILMVLASLGIVSACGRKGDPEPPPGTDYPRTYPAR